MKSSTLASLLLAAFTAFSTGAFAQHHDTSAGMPEAQMQGSDKAKAAAEARHNAKTHGASSSAEQPEAK